MEQKVKGCTTDGIPIHVHSPQSNAERNRVNAKLDSEMPCGHKMNGRNLVVCIDGTANQFGNMNTNVIELYNLLLKEVGENAGQRTWYNSGIGTYARPSWKSLNYYKQALYHKIDLAIAWDFERTVLGAYRWLSDNYKTDDCIFLFGFSRGAYQVRVLSAMIDKVGLIYKGNELQIPFAYELYADSKSDERTATEVGSQEPMSMAERFKKAFSHKDVRVHFVGAWDTVSSIGIARGKRMLPRTINGMKHVCYFRHALALDERRVKFLPEYAYGGTSKDPKSGDKDSARIPQFLDSDLEGESQENASPTSNKGTIDSSQTKEATGDRPQTLEVWFAGTHSDIGGGNVQNAGMDRSRPPLRWMVFEAGAVGLRTALFERELSSKEQIEIKESLTGFWWILEMIPFKRLTFTRKPNGKKVTHWPHLGSRRKIHPDQKIHSSLILADRDTKTKYIPKARPLHDDDSFWKNFSDLSKIEWLERDLYEYTEEVIGNYTKDPNRNTLQTLQRIGTSGDGRQALYENVITFLSTPETDLKVKYQLLRLAVDVPPRSRSKLKLSRSVEIRPFLSELLDSGNNDYRKTAQEFMVQFSDPCVFVLRGHNYGVWSVSFSPNGKWIASGSRDQTVCIWDVGTGMAVGEPLQGHTNSVRSVAFSPDGKGIASGSSDGTVWIWNVETRKPVRKLFQENQSWVNSVAFSPGGKQIAAGLDDGTVWIWDIETGEAIGSEPFYGGPINSVAFSPDGRHIASGSSDKTVQIWDVKTGMAVGEPFQGHAGWVNSVAFSPDGKYIASGSSDETVWIWDVGTGEAVGEPFREHTNWVNSVAFSPDSKWIVSGSRDKTIRIWDMETGMAVRGPFQGHTNWVRSVEFSPDGKQIASGSYDGTVRIWDVEMGK